MAATSMVEIREPRDGELIRVNPAANSRGRLLKVTDDEGRVWLAPEDDIDKAKATGCTVETVTCFMAVNDLLKQFLWPVDDPVPDNHPAWTAMTKWVEIVRVKRD